MNNQVTYSATVTPDISMTKEELIRLKQIMQANLPDLYYRPDEGTKPDNRSSWIQASSQHSYHHEFMTGQPLGKLLSFNYIRFVDELPAPEKKEVPFESKDIKPRHMVFRNKNYPLDIYTVAKLNSAHIYLGSMELTYEELYECWEYTIHLWPADPVAIWSPCKKVLGDK